MNALLAGVGVAVGALAGAGVEALSAAPLTLLFATFTGILGTAYGNILNDIHDQRVDRVAHPHRPLPSGRATRMAAWNLALLLWLGTIVLAALVGVHFLLLTVILLALLFAYERRLKAHGLIGNLAVAVAAGALFPLGALAFPTPDFQVPLLLGLLAAFAHLGRELLKDAEDVSADRAFRHTFAVTNGPEAAARLGGLFLLSGVLVSPLPHIFADWGWRFLLALVPADALFIAASFQAARNPRAARATAKLGMIFALAAFALGALEA